MHLEIKVSENTKIKENTKPTKKMEKKKIKVTVKCASCPTIISRKDIDKTCVICKGLYCGMCTYNLTERIKYSGYKYTSKVIGRICKRHLKEFQILDK